MTADDVPLGLRLKDQAGWNQTEADWLRILALEPDGCFVAELDGQAVGTTCTSLFDSIGWVAMVLVDKSVRGRGIGTRLMEHALEHLDRRGVRTMRLDATPLGRPIYEKLGFVAEYELERWEGIAQDASPPARVNPTTADQFDAICRLDQEATGTNRRRLLERLYQERPEDMRVVLEARTVVGYTSLRVGSRAVQIGPGVARNAAAGHALLEAATHAHAGQPIFLDLPVDNRPAGQWAQSHGLRVQRPLTRMRRGDAIHDRPAQLWGCFGPEKG